MQLVQHNPNPRNPEIPNLQTEHMLMLAHGYSKGNGCKWSLIKSIWNSPTNIIIWLKNQQLQNSRFALCVTGTTSVIAIAAVWRCCQDAFDDKKKKKNHCIQNSLSRKPFYSAFRDWVSNNLIYKWDSSPSTIRYANDRQELDLKTTVLCLRLTCDSVF